MADKHPYMSGSGGVNQLVTQLRRSFPSTVTAETLKKLGIAPNNETYVLNILRFIGVLDDEHKKSAAAGTIFNKHDDADFQAGFAKCVADAYHELFDLHGSDAWTLSQDKLISFFRNHDGTSAVVGTRQATTFQALGRISGKVIEGTPAEKPRVAASNTAKAVKKSTAKVSTATTPPLVPVSVPSDNLKVNPANSKQPMQAGMALTVRIEINLPAGGDQSTYDYIFKSIRENLLNSNDA